MHTIKEWRKMEKLNRQSAIKNYIYQFMYQALTLIIPLFLSPYLTRTLGGEALGNYAYSNSIAYYFVLFGMLGISRHGQRVISANSDDNEKLRKKFWSLIYIHTFFSAIAVMCYCLFIFFFIHENRNIYIVQIFFVMSALFDITWLFQGLENFRDVINKNLIVQISECVLIFLFVNKPSDIYIYGLIVSVGTCIGQAALLPKAIKLIRPITVGKEDICEHIKPLFILAITVFAAALYTVFDKTLLGILADKKSVAFYEYSDKIIKIPKTFITVIGTVLFPRACRLAAKEDINGQIKYYRYSLIITSIIGIGSLFGILALGQQIAIAYYGEEFSLCGKIIMIMSPLIFIVGLGDVLRTQYLIPKKMDFEFAKCLCINAIINVIVSGILIPYMGVYGAVIGTLAAELFGLCYQMNLCKEIASYIELLKIVLPFVVIGSIMYIIIQLLVLAYGSSLAMIIIEAMAGGLVYAVFSIIYLSIFQKDFILVLISKIKK